MYNLEFNWDKLAKKLSRSITNITFEQFKGDILAEVEKDREAFGIDPDHCLSMSFDWSDLREINLGFTSDNFLELLQKELPDYKIEMKLEDEKTVYFIRKLK